MKHVNQNKCTYTCWLHYTVTGVIHQITEPQVPMLYILKKIFNYIYFYLFFLLAHHWKSQLYCMIIGFRYWKI